MKVAFYGSSILSSYWNGAATYYRGLIKALAAKGHDVTFYEPDAFGRQERRDIDPPGWCRVVVYPGTAEEMHKAALQAARADVVVKASGVGVFDDELLEATMAAASEDAIRIWWDVDAPATLAAIEPDPQCPLRRLLPELDAVLTYGGGAPIVEGYRALGARICRPIYNGLDPETHHPVTPDPRFACDLAFLGNRLPDREARVHGFFIEPARRAPQWRFLLGGAGWEPEAMPENVRALGHVPTRDHNAFNVTPRAVLNINRESMAERGFSPPTRVFEAAGAGACLITDEWVGIDQFLAPGDEVLVARDGQDVLDLLSNLTEERARGIGERARSRMLAEHTYSRRAGEVDLLMRELVARKRQGVAA